MSKLARCLPDLSEKLDGAVLLSEFGVSGPLPESIWNGNEPNPFDIVDSCEPVDIPSSLRFGGDSGSAASGVCGSGDVTVTVELFDGVLKACCASGERGGVRIGRSEIGEGGTNGKFSRIESARVDVELTTDARDIRESSSSRARFCCRSSAPPGWVGVDSLLPMGGDTIFALVIRYCERAVLRGAVIGVCGRSLDGGASRVRPDARPCGGDSWLRPRCTRDAVPMFADMIEAACVLTLDGRGLLLAQGERGVCGPQCCSLSPKVADVGAGDRGGECVEASLLRYGECSSLKGLLRTESSCSCSCSSAMGSSGP